MKEPEPPREEKPEPRAEKPTHKPEPEAEEEDKPWLQHTTFVFPRVVSAKLSPRHQSMQLQMLCFRSHQSFQHLLQSMMSHHLMNSFELIFL